MLSSEIQQLIWGKKLLLFCSYKELTDHWRVLCILHFQRYWENSGAAPEVFIGSLLNQVQMNQVFFIEVTMWNKLQLRHRYPGTGTRKIPLTCTRNLGCLHPMCGHVGIQWKEINPSVFLLDSLGVSLRRHIFLPFSPSCESFLLPFLLLLIHYLSGKEGGELNWCGVASCHHLFGCSCFCCAVLLQRENLRSDPTLLSEFSSEATQEA